jgi:hypothetical protein
MVVISSTADCFTIRILTNVPYAVVNPLPRPSSQRVSCLDSLPLIFAHPRRGASTLSIEQCRSHVCRARQRGQFQSHSQKQGDAMKIANAMQSMEPHKPVKFARAACIAAACILATTPMLAQGAAGNDQRSGVSHPSSAPITTDTFDAQTPVATSPAKPSADIPATAATSSNQYGPYVPYRPAGAAEPAAATAPPAFDPDANIVTSATAGREQRRLLVDPNSTSGTVDEDAGIVTSVPSAPGEIPQGSLLKVRLREQLSTMTTQPGTQFTAEVSDPLMRDGQVVIPTGSVLDGRVTWVRGGKRIGGPAAIHLEPRTVTLPDGTQYRLRARAIDTDQWDNTRVDDEGTIMRSENKKRNVAVMSLTTGSGMAAGAMIGGVPGAVIGAGVGAGVSSVMWLKQDRQAVLPKDLQVVFSLTEPMSVTPTSAAFAPIKPIPSGGE